MRLTKSVLGDIVLAVALAVVGVLGTAGADMGADPDRSIDSYGFALVLASALSLCVRRRWPLVTLAAAATTTSTYLIVGYTYGPILLSFLVAVYTVARRVALPRAAAASGAALALMLTHLLTNSAALPGFLGLIPGSA